MDIFAPQTLAGIVENIKPVPTFFTQLAFGLEKTSDTDSISLDIKEYKSRITPFVHPMSEAGIVEQAGYETKTIKPAYLKDKREFNPNKALTRKAGEAIGGSLTAQQRQEAILMEEAMDAMAMFDRRIETMCAEALLSATQTVIGKGYNLVVNFGRAAGNTITTTSGDKWDAVDSDGYGTADIPKQLMDASLIVSKAGGGVVRAIVMDYKAYGLFRKNKFVTSKDSGWVTSGTVRSTILDPKSLVEGEALYMGNLGAFEIWVYNYEYINPVTGSAANVMPDNTCLLIGSNVQGVQHFGAIKDAKAIETGAAAVRTYMKSWVSEDPGVRYVLLQSAPLMVPYRPNATVKIVVA